MDNLYNPDDAALLAFDPTFDPNTNRLYHINPQTWPLTADQMSQSQHHQLHSQQPQQPQQTHSSSSPSNQLQRANTTSVTSSQPATSTTAPPLQSTHLSYTASGLETALLTDWSQFQMPMPQQNAFTQDGTMDPATFQTFGGPLQNSPIEADLFTQHALSTTISMDGANGWVSAPVDMAAMSGLVPFQMADFQHELINYSTEGMAAYDQNGQGASSSIGGSSPGENWLEIRSMSSGDEGWNAVEFPQNRRSWGSFNNDAAIVFNPTQTLHIRTESNNSHHSDVPRSATSFSSYDDTGYPLNSPESERNLDFSNQPIPQGIPIIPADVKHQHSDSCGHSHHNSPVHGSVSPAALTIEPAPNAASPPGSGSGSPPARRRKSPTDGRDKVVKVIQKKQPAHSTKKDNVTEKRVGRRRGPLRPEQRQQAHEIRKLRACLRCKFLKKTCDKGDPCGGCQPSHARLWQVPCTRIDIKDIAYFMKDWKADYERHVSLGFSVGNIKGFSQIERQIFVTHGYGFYLPINAREVYVRDDKCFGVDWVESIHPQPKAFEAQTAKLSAGMEGISHAMLSEYLDRHIDQGFERFVDEYFEGTFFLTEILKTAYRFYLREKLPVIRKALKLVVAYNLTLHVTMVEGLGDDEQSVGRVENSTSKFCGKTVAPVMINFQVKCALADMWRELQKDVLEELSTLYSSVYSGDKLKNWPTIFMLAAILLAVWELMQFDCHYRIPDEKAVEKFCNDMESTPVGVIVGLFSAISQKLPSFSEWDTRKHHHLLASNPAVCDAMTEVRAHVHKYDSYLRSRSDTKFDRQDFDSLSNKFLSKLVIRAN